MSKFRKIFLLLRIIPQSIYFNFRCLPFRQAIKLPILIRKGKLQQINGKIEISGRIKFGMVRLGFYNVSIYPDNGIIWGNSGKVTFNGDVSIGNNSAISVGSSGHLIFGNHFRASAGLKCVCYNKIVFDEYVLIGWDNIISDTDFHTLHTENGKTKGYGEIHIGPHNWFAMQSLILKGAKTPKYCILSARSLLNKDITSEGERILLTGQPAKIAKRNIYHDGYDDSIDYSDRK